MATQTIECRSETYKTFPDSQGVDVLFVVGARIELVGGPDIEERGSLGTVTACHYSWASLAWVAHVAWDCGSTSWIRASYISLASEGV